MKTEIKIGGFGGQGVILSAHIIGKAAAIYADKFATMIQSFGPEARGSSCSAQVIISDKPVTYPYVKNPDILIVMSQESYTKFLPELKEGGILITESDLIDTSDIKPNIKHYSIPSTRIAEELGKKLILNIVMVGFFTAIAKELDREFVYKAVESSVPKGTEDLNLAAFNRGYYFGMDFLSKV
jgi:2-oxoglutarate ferredoxin oxidoreductase subunit gamma